MIQPHIQFSLANAQEYFREHLSAGDYYSQGMEVVGEWLGQGAERLGLQGMVNEAAFLALCEGKNPATDQKLGQRMNTIRQEVGRDTVANRRIFYDFVIAPPKSVSVVALYQDDRILGLHKEAVRQTMLELEKFAETRVRKSGQNSERVTGNLVTACFRHDTSRELDPHLHTHCVVFNATFDSVESRWKALHPAGMYYAKDFATNLYRHELCKGLRAFGYEIENTARSFEIKGVPASVIARFSKRNQQINEETNRRLEIGSPVVNVGELRKRIAHGNRRRKLKDSTADRLRPSWEKQLTADETKALGALRFVQPKPAKPADVAGITAWADEHLFERRSVVNDYELMSAALARGRGEDFDLGTLRTEVGRRNYVREEGSRRLTSRETLKRELAVVVAAHDGQRMHNPLSPSYRPSEGLSKEQRGAVEQILKSEDFITLFRGAAGTGKSFALREVVNGLRAAGLPFVAVAPQRQQATDLAENGIEATTLAHCLETKGVPLRGIVLVDEAGQVSGKQLSDLTALVQMKGGRMILSGDTRQHGPVEASDILRAIERKAGLTPAVLREIRRQDPALAKSRAEKGFIGGYRRAVKAASDGRSADSFDQLNRLGCVREVSADNRRDQLAAEYVASLERQENPLVVAQTWNEVTAVNDSIREALRERGRIGDGATIKTLHAVDLTDAEKRDARFYQPGHVAYFQKRYGRYKRGDCCPVLGANERGVILEKNGRRSTLSFNYVDRLALTEERDMVIAAGDRLQLKFNGKSLDGRSLANGELVTVRQVRPDGAMDIEDAHGQRKTLAANQRLFNRGYAVTSYGSQGKTVDTVLFADSGCRAATTAEQWYVTISRGRRRVTIFTEDKTALRAAVSRQGGKDLALDLLRGPEVPDAPGECNAISFIEQIRRHHLVTGRNTQPQERNRIAL